MGDERRATIALLAALATMGAAAQPAEAAGVIPGKTAQGRAATVHLDDSGAVSFIAIHWRARCATSNHFYRETTSWVAPFDRSSGKAIFDAGSYPTRPARGLRGTIRATLHARRRSALTWKGTFSVTAVVRRHRRVVDRCHLGPARWRAHAPQMAATLTGDAGDFITQGKSYSTNTPKDRVVVVGTRRFLSFNIPPFAIQIQPPAGRRLTPGTFSATRFGFNGKGGGLSIDGDGRGCNELSGTVTIESSSFDRRGKLKAIVVTFEQHCEGMQPAARGRLEYRR